MPAVYLSGKFNCEITLVKDDYPYSDWIDDNLAQERQAYERPNLGLWLQIENTDDNISPFAIPVTELDIYEGAFNCSRNGLTFKFEFDGKAKVNVNKDTKAAVDRGEKPKATEVSINGASYSFDQPVEVSFIIQSKKL